MLPFTPIRHPLPASTGLHGANWSHPVSKFKGIGRFTHKETDRNTCSLTGTTTGAGHGTPGRNPGFRDSVITVKNGMLSNVGWVPSRSLPPEKRDRQIATV